MTNIQESDTRNGEEDERKLQAETEMRAAEQHAVNEVARILAEYQKSVERLSAPLGAIAAVITVSGTLIRPIHEDSDYPITVEGPITIHTMLY